MNEAARLMCDLALDPVLRQTLRDDPDGVLSRYSLTSAERAAIADGSGDAMLALLGHAIGGGAVGMETMAVFMILHLYLTLTSPQPFRLAK